MKRNRKKLKNPVQVTIFDQSKLVFERIFEEYPVVLGRSPRADISLANYEFISKQHAAIVEYHDELLIVDLDSANGIMFQGKRTKRAPVTEDASITVGPLILRFRVLTPELTLAITESHTEMEKTKVIEHKEEPVHAVAQRTEVAPRQQSKPVDPDATLISHPRAQAPKPEPKHEPRHEAKHEPRAFAAQKPEPKKEIKKQPEVRHAKPQAVAHHASSHEHSHFHDPILEGGFELVTPHPHASKLKQNQKVLEAYVTWQDSVFDVQQFMPGERVTIGRGYTATLNLPTLSKKIDVAFYDGQKTQCFIPNGSTLTVRNPEREITMDELMQSQAISKKNNGYLLKLGNDELASFDLGPGLNVHFRYAPAPRQLSRMKMVEPDQEIRKTMFGSGIVHFIIMAIAILNAPTSHGPKLKDVPDRYARLLVEPPRKIIEEKKPEPPKPEPKKEEKKVVEKKQPEKKIVKKIIQQPPKKVVLQKTPVLQQVNKFPTTVTKNVAATPSKSTNPAPVNVNALGALSALTALGPKNATPSNVPVAINVNANAGGPSKFTTTGVLGTLKSSTGKLAGGGIQSVQTKGLGVGSGTGYGIQGLKGTAGSRGIAGGIVGTPQIMSVSPDEGLTRKQVMDVVKKYLGQIQQCYERSLFQTPGLAGKVEYEWEITPQGGVTWVRVKASQMSGADAMNSCVTGLFKGMKFPTAKNGQHTIPSIPLEFGKL